MRARRRWGAAILAATLIGTFGMAAPAHAVPSGFGWSGSWRYYTVDAFEAQVTLPGGDVSAYSTDQAGLRHLLGNVTDTSRSDRYCARARVISTDAGLIASETACNGGQESFDTPIVFGAVFVHLDLMQGNTIVKSTFTFIPSSADDPTLRTVNTGTSWEYQNASQYHLEVHRPGVDVIADGVHQNATERSIAGTVVDTGIAGSCSDGRATDTAITFGNVACGPGAFANFSSFDYVGYINMTGCYYPPAATARCLMVHFPEPY